MWSTMQEPALPGTVKHSPPEPESSVRESLEVLDCVDCEFFTAFDGCGGTLIGMVDSRRI